MDRNRNVEECDHESLTNGNRGVTPNTKENGLSIEKKKASIIY